MAVAAGLHRPRLRHARLLAQPGQRVVFAEDGDHRTALAGFADHRGGNAGDILGHPETLLAQFGEMFGGGAGLAVAELGHRPDAVAQRDETALDSVNVKPNVAAISIFRSLIPVRVQIASSFARPRLAPAGTPAMRRSIEWGRLGPARVEQLAVEDRARRVWPGFDGRHP